MMLPGGVLPWAALEPLAARIAPLGWHIDLQLDGNYMPLHEAVLLRLPCRPVIDRLGKFLAPVTTDAPAFRSLCRVLDGGNTRIKIAAPYETSRAGPPAYADIVEPARAFVRGYPDRCVWASNWPHPNIVPTPSNTTLFDWAQACVGDDAVWQRILVDNPARLYDYYSATKQAPR